jgi:hypothetical protein
MASACFCVGSPLVAVSAADSPGANRQVSWSFGDCKNQSPDASHVNTGKHNGYDCPDPASVQGSGDSGSGSVTGTTDPGTTGTGTTGTGTTVGGIIG